MKNLAIIGAGHLGQQIAYHVTNDKQFNVVGFFDDFAEAETTLNGFKILGKIEAIETLFKVNAFNEIIIGIGYKHFNFREALYQKFNNKVPLATFIHSSCFVDVSCSIGHGVFMFPGSVLDQNVSIEDNVIINVNGTIAHDTKIGKHTFLSPRVAIAGFVKIGESCNIGINVTIIDNINITDKVQLGGGTVVINNIEMPGLYVGNPSKFIR